MDKQLWYFHTTKYYLEIKTHALFFFFGHVACGILVFQPGLSPAAPAVEAQSLNWTARQVPTYTLDSHNYVD